MGGWWIWQTNERCRRRAAGRCTRLAGCPQAHRAVYGFALKLAFGVDGGIEDVRFVQTEHHRACRAAPGRVGGFDVEAVFFFFVVMIGRVQMVEIDGLFSQNACPR